MYIFVGSLLETDRDEVRREDRDAEGRPSN